MPQPKATSCRIIRGDGETTSFSASSCTSRPRGISSPKPKNTLETREGESRVYHLSLSLVGSFWRQWLHHHHLLQLLSDEAFQELPLYTMFKPILLNQASIVTLPSLFFKRGHLFLSHLSLRFILCNLSPMNLGSKSDL